MSKRHVTCNGVTYPTLKVFFQEIGINVMYGYAKFESGMSLEEILKEREDRLVLWEGKTYKNLTTVCKELGIYNSSVNHYKKKYNVSTQGAIQMAIDRKCRLGEK